MADLPDGAELLRVARRTLLDDLLPLLPAEKIYEARMVAKVMAIATRELDKAHAVAQDNTAAIFAFLESFTTMTSAEPSEEVLADVIRNRSGNPGSHEALYALLVQLTRSKLTLSNPKALSEAPGLA